MEENKPENPSNIESRLIVGACIKIGDQCAEICGLEVGKIITLIEGYFEDDNGLYTYTEQAPAIWNESEKDFDSIYHLFGNKLEYFLDSEIIDNQNIKL